MREVEFSEVIIATPKTSEEAWQDFKKMSDKEQIDFMLSDKKRYDGPEYLLEYDNGKKARGQLVGRNIRGQIGPKNSKWFIPKTSEYIRFGSRTNSIKIYKPTAKKLMYEQVLRQKIGDPYLASVMKTKHMIGKGKKQTRRYCKTSNKTRKHNRK